MNNLLKQTNEETKMKNTKVNRDSDWWKQFAARLKAKDKAWEKELNKKTVGCTAKPFFNNFKVL